MTKQTEEDKQEKVSVEKKKKPNKPQNTPVSFTLGDRARIKLAKFR